MNVQLASLAKALMLYTLHDCFCEGVDVFDNASLVKRKFVPSPLKHQLWRIVWSSEQIFKSHVLNSNFIFNMRNDLYDVNVQDIMIMNYFVVRVV